MAEVKIAADSGGGSTAITGPASTTGNANLSYKLPDGTTGGIIKTSTYPSSIQVLEQFYTPCDGSVIATANGNITTETVSAAQDLTDTFTEVAGANITYTPPSGATQVIYEYSCMFRKSSSTGPIASFKLSIGGTEVTNFRRVVRCDDDTEQPQNFKWGFNIGGTANAASGRLASWTSGQEITFEVRRYSSSYPGKLHMTDHWEGSGGTDQFSMPCIGITAIGAH